MSLQISWRGDEQTPADGKAFGDEPGIADRPMPQYRVEAVGSHVDKPVVELQRNLDLGVLDHQTAHCGPRAAEGRVGKEWAVDIDLWGRSSLSKNQLTY